MVEKLTKEDIKGIKKRLELGFLAVFNLIQMETQFCTF